MSKPTGRPHPKSPLPRIELERGELAELRPPTCPRIPAPGGPISRPPTILAPWVVALTLTFVTVALGIPSAATARSLTDVFRTKLAGLELEPLGPALAATVASTYPVASASSSVIFKYDPALDTYTRDTGVLGPIFGERAETIGMRRLDLSLSYSYVRPTSINGQSLSKLTNRVTLFGNRVVNFPVPGGVRLADGRVTTFLPIEVVADIDVEAQILSPGVTFGLLPDVDLNLTLPFLRTFLRVRTDVTVPDPRLPMFALPPNDPNARELQNTSTDSAVGAGDLLLRLKWLAIRSWMANVALGLATSFPTGDPEDLQGAGAFLVEPSLIASRIVADRVELLANAGVQLNAEDVDRSVARWIVGITSRLAGPTYGSFLITGRNEFDAQTDPISAPFFLQVERNDQYDASIGIRVLVGDAMVVSANVLLPLNDEGLRTDLTPTLVVETLF